MNKFCIAVHLKAVDKIKRISFLFVLLCAGYTAVANDPFEGPNGSSLDASPPVISYTPLPSTCSSAARTLTATITDADGVPTSGAGLPVIYWQINAGLPTATPGVSIGSNQYNFTFGAGAAAGSLVTYYIVAQDNAATPNVIARPSAGAGGYSSSPPAASTEPTTPDFYVVQATLPTGTYTVGVGQTYITLTDAVNAYNNSCLSGPVTFVLTDANYNTSETFPITIFNAAASSVNTLTIKPNTGINASITGSAPDALIKLNGADYVTIDGSNSGGATKNLSLTNNNTGLLSTIFWLGSSSASNGATNNTIKNCTLTGNASNTTYAGILSSSGVVAGAIAETANANNTYLNNSIQTSYIGIAVWGPAGSESGTVISTNTIGSTQSSKKMGYRGIFISNQTNVQVINNTVAGVLSSFGIGSEADPTGGIIVSGAISGGSINANIINDIRNTNVSGWHAHGITLQSSSASSGLKISNNFIYNVTGNGNTTTVSDNGHGIAIQTGGGYGIYFNAINLAANQPAVTGGISACIFIGAGVTGTASLDIRNNILSNRQTTGTRYALYSSVPNIVFSNINYNDYYSAGFLGYLGANRATIAAWQAATGFDGNSVVVSPIFVSATDLHLQPISPLNDQGTPIAGITTDIDAAGRSATPDIGADEFTPPNCTNNSGGTAVSDFITICSSGSIALSATGFSYGLGITYQWESSTDNVSYSAIPGETNPTSANPPVISVTTWYRLRVACSLIGGTPGYSNAIMITVYNPQLLTTTPASRCGPGTLNLSATGTAGTNIDWYTTATGGAPVFTGGTFTTPSIAATTTYYVESTYPGSSGTVGPVSPTAQGGTISTQLTSWDVTFNVLQATKLLTVDVYPITAGENSIIDVYNSSGVIIASVPYTTTVSGGNTAQTVTMNVTLPIKNGYYLYATAGLPPSGLTRNITNAVYPYNSTDIQITGNGFDQNFYMCYYKWRFSNGCSSNPRTAVVATIGVSSPLNVTATPPTICAGSSSVLNVTSANGSYIYTWTPGPLIGPSHTVSPAVTTTYNVTGNDGTCSATGSVTVTVNPSSSNVVIAPVTVTKCASEAAQLLTASGGDITGIPIISENFNGATIPTGWVAGTAGSTSTAANITACQWTLRPDGYVYPGTTFHSNDNSQFYLSNSDANPNLTRTTLKTPPFSLVGYTSANLNFWHYFAANGLPDSIAVEISQNNVTWTVLYSSIFSRGGSISFANRNVNLSAYIGQATNYIRFRYVGNDGFQWAIDNVNITGDNSGAPITWAPLAGLFTDAGAVTAYTGLAATTVYAKPAVSTTYTATASPVNGCSKSLTVDVNVRSLSAFMTGSTSVCPSGSATISVALTGTAPWNLTYTDGSTPVTITGIATSPYTFIVNPLVTTTYTVTGLSDQFCTAAAPDLTGSAVITVNPSSVSTWLGVSTDWTDPLNWCGGVPGPAKDVVIPGSLTFYPIITTATPAARDVTIAAAANILIDPSGTLSFAGVVINNGTITNNGNIVLNGSSAQTFPGGTNGIIAAMNNIEVDNSAGATINRSLTITGTLKPTAGIITLNNDTIRLRSTATATARVDALGATAGFAYTGTGKFSVERYISSATKVGWRFLAAPIGGTQTINQAWQEAQAAGSYTSTGFGMQIVGPSAAGSGFDMNNALPSVKRYDTASRQWVSIPGTVGAISSKEGYMAFIRGDRGSNTFGSQSSTTLRMAGPIKTGTITVASPPDSTNRFISVGNPYPSAIDFTATTRNNLQNVYYVWDPKLNTYGAYQTFAGPGYVASPGGGSYGSGNKFIESGQAFFVIANAAVAPHQIIFSETSKVGSNSQVARPEGLGMNLRTNLLLVSGGTTSLYDGNRVDFDAVYSNNVDDNDALKLGNFGENLGLRRGAKLLSVERRSEVVDTDTIFYVLGQLRQQQYQLEFTPEHFITPGLTAFLEDAYLDNTTVVGLEGVTTVNFAVNGDAGSYANDRFRLVFRQLAPVPVTFTSIRAEKRDKNILVSWKVENELNIDHYEIEKSADGRNFDRVAVQSAYGNGTSTTQYSWLDQNSFGGDNFYRVRSVGIGNEVKYSSIVKVNITDIYSDIVVYPNPVKNGLIQISLINQLKGEYTARLFSQSGQLMMSKNFNLEGGNATITMDVGHVTGRGIYKLEIVLSKAKKRKKIMDIMLD